VVATPLRQALAVQGEARPLRVDRRREGREARVDPLGGALGGGRIPGERGLFVADQRGQGVHQGPLHGVALELGAGEVHVRPDARHEQNQQRGQWQRERHDDQGEPRRDPQTTKIRPGHGDSSGHGFAEVLKSHRRSPRGVVRRRGSSDIRRGMNVPGSG
jgi:hypothetical protein